MAKVPKGRTASGVAAIAVGQHMNFVNCQESSVRVIYLVSCGLGVFRVAQQRARVSKMCMLSTYM